MKEEKYTKPLETEMIEFDPFIAITIKEYSRLKDIETRFEIIKQEMLRADYVSLHTQIVLGIENEYKAKEIDVMSFMKKEQ